MGDNLNILTVEKENPVFHELPNVRKNLEFMCSVYAGSNPIK